MAQKLRVARGLRLRISDNGKLLASVSKSSGDFEMTLDVLELLKLLSRVQGDAKRLSQELKRSIDGVAKNLPPQEEIEGLLFDLQDAGVVVGGETQEGGIQDGFGDPWIQWAMVADSVRTQKYFEALGRVLSKDSVVLDVGAGTGVFSAFALQKGVQHVYAIEETATADEIPKILKRMGISAEGRFTLLRANSADAKFPKNVNVVVSELFGNDPFGEGMMATLADIAKRVDARTTKFIPGSFEVFAEVIDVMGGAAHHRLEAYVGKNEGKLENFYDQFLMASRGELDFSTLSFPIFLSESEFSVTSNRVSLGSVSLKDFSASSVLCGKKTLTLNSDASVPVALIWFRATLCDGVTVSSRVGEKDFAVHWSPLLVPLSARCFAGDILQLDHGTDDELTQIQLEITRLGKVIGAR